MKYSLIFLLFLLGFGCNTPVPQPATIQPVTFDTVPQWSCKQMKTNPRGVEQAVGQKGSFWPNASILRVGFLDGTPAQINMVKQLVPEWSKYANITFTFPAMAPFDIRVSFNANDGAWSYVGTDAKSVTSGPTVNLGWQAPDVIWHEFGHAIGLLHEQQNPVAGIKWNPPVVYAALEGPPNYWDKNTIDQNVLTPYPAASVIATPWDKTSIMHYSIPANWTIFPGVAIAGGKVISDADKAFIALQYPGVNVTPPPPVAGKVTITTAQRDNIIRLLSKEKLYADSSLTASQKAFGL